MGQTCGTCCHYCCDYCCNIGGCYFINQLCCFGCLQACRKCNHCGCCQCCCEDPRLFNPNDPSSLYNPNRPPSTVIKSSSGELDLIVGNKNEEKKEKIIPSHIILMGDSVLDNFYWLKDKSLDIKQQIINQYLQDGINVQVTNLAVDESETKDVLHGIRPNWVYVSERRDLNLEKYPMDKDDNIVYPLKLLSDLITQHNNGNNNNNNDDDKNDKITRVLNPSVVLSVGGNDFRMVLAGGGDAESFKYGAYSMIEGMIESNFLNNMKQIVSTLLPHPKGKSYQISDSNKKMVKKEEENKNDGLFDEDEYGVNKEKQSNLNYNNFQMFNNQRKFTNIQLILVYPYQPGTTWHVYNTIPNNKILNEFAIRQFFNVMEWGFKSICDIAFEYNLPIIDLSRTFDANDETHFGMTPIEPSNKSGQYISDLVKYVLLTYDFENNKQKSWIYYGIRKNNENWDGITVEKNNKQAKNRYKNDLKKRNVKILGGKQDIKAKSFTVGDKRMYETAVARGNINAKKRQGIRVEDPHAQAPAT